MKTYFKLFFLIFSLILLLTEHSAFAQTAYGYYQIGKRYESAGDFKQASLNYEQSVTLEPTNLAYVRTLAETYVKLNDFVQAKSMYYKEAGLSLDNKNTSRFFYSFNQAISFETDNELIIENKISYYSRLVEIEPNIGSNWRLLSDSYLADEQFEKASNALLKEAEIKKNLGLIQEYYYLLGLAEDYHTDSQLYVPVSANSDVKLNKYEPVSGAYIGAFIEKDCAFLGDVCFGGTPPLSRYQSFNNSTGKKHAIFFTYRNYGDPLMKSNEGENYIDAIKQAHGSLQLAFQPQIGLDKVQDDAYLRQFAKDLNQTGIPIFLRFASEMNGEWVPWNGNPDLYKEKWKLVYNVMKQEAPNVAMLWSPSESPLSSIESYYPGDEYVDWVGISIYSKKYANGDINKNEENKNPLEALDYIYKLHADTKPIMISEYAASHQITSEKLDSTLFAVTKMSMFYEGIKLKYPKVKSINWFSYNTYLHDIDPSKQVSNYSLFENQEVLNRYKSIIHDDYFLSDVVNGPYVNNQTTIPSVYKPFSNITITKDTFLTNWVKLHDPYIQKVIYRLNGVDYATSSFYPYDFMVKQSDLKGGFNTLDIIAFDSKGVERLKKSETLYKPFYTNKHIKLFLSDTVAYTNNNYSQLMAAPFVLSNRTMVPLRFISEQLGYPVSWDATTKTITISGKKKMVLKVDDISVNIDGSYQVLDVAPVIKNNTTFVPIRFVTEILGYNVNWNNTEKSIVITY